MNSEINANPASSVIRVSTVRILSAKVEAFACFGPVADAKLPRETKAPTNSNLLSRKAMMCFIKYQTAVGLRLD
jgi:hypothetical protein